MTINQALQIQNLNLSVTGNWNLKRKQLLKDIDLDISNGESFGFLGHNGAGKTTTIKAILGLIKPSSGSVKIFGLDNKLTESRKDVGYLAEQPYFYESLTVKETLELYGTLAGVERCKLQEAIKEVLETVKISARYKSPLKTLSKGLTQRVGLAQAIINRPKLLILDEPFSGLDPIGRYEFREIFSKLKHTGTTLFICTHVLSDVEFLCDRASIMVKGEIKSIIKMEDLPKLTAGRYELVIQNSISPDLISDVAPQSINNLLKFEFNNKKIAELALQNAVKNGVSIESFNFLQGSLEELFVKLVNFDESSNEVRHE